MSIIDILLPHRLLINKELRKEADTLRRQINYYQENYDKRVAECEYVIERVKEEKNRQLEAYRDNLIQELNNEFEQLTEVRDLIFQYVDLYLQTELLKKTREILATKRKIVIENDEFLYKQMVIVGDEVNLLKERQKELSSFVSVNEYIQLAETCGIKDLINTDIDVSDYLEKIDERINIEESRECKYALVRLRNIIQERSDYNYLIKYTSWIIQQKISYSKQLSEKRRGLRPQISTIKGELDGLNADIKSNNMELETLRNRIKDYWIRPVTLLNAGRSYTDSEFQRAVQKKKETSRNLREAQERIKRYKEYGESNQDTWEEINKRSKECYEANNAAKAAIEELNRKYRETRDNLDSWRNSWKRLIEICKNNNITLFYTDSLSYGDQRKYVTKRLGEIDIIRQEGLKDQNDRLVAQRVEINQEYYARFDNTEKRISELETKMFFLEKEITKQEEGVKLTQNWINNSKKNDNRFFLKKVFSETEEMQNAKKANTYAKNALAEAQRNKNSLIQQIKGERDYLEKLSFEKEYALKSCKATLLRPTEDEIVEESLLLYWKEEMSNKGKENGNGSWY